MRKPWWMMKSNCDPFHPLVEDHSAVDENLSYAARSKRKIAISLKSNPNNSKMMTKTEHFLSKRISMKWNLSNTPNQIRLMP